MLLKETKRKEPKPANREPFPIRNPHAYNKDNISKSSGSSSKSKSRKTFL
jgi:hypothetical protein